MAYLSRNKGTTENRVNLYAKEPKPSSAGTGLRGRPGQFATDTIRDLIAGKSYEVAYYHSPFAVQKVQKLNFRGA